mmetsp:Transcript_3408/g.5647  ORF Transcript_3408/g.5647 Transcript_3408/m.5647 type:complete len:607 (+) Transcript_3408:31-1851(+)
MSDTFNPHELLSKLRAKSSNSAVGSVSSNSVSPSHASTNSYHPNGNGSVDGRNKSHTRGIESPRKQASTVIRAPPSFSLTPSQRQENLAIRMELEKEIKRLQTEVSTLQNENTQLRTDKEEVEQQLIKYKVKSDEIITKLRGEIAAIKIHNKSAADRGAGAGKLYPPNGQHRGPHVDPPASYTQQQATGGSSAYKTGTVAPGKSYHGADHLHPAQQSNYLLHGSGRGGGALPSPPHPSSSNSASSSSGGGGGGSRSHGSAAVPGSGFGPSPGPSMNGGGGGAAESFRDPTFSELMRRSTPDHHEYTHTLRRNGSTKLGTGNMPPGSGSGAAQLNQSSNGNNIRGNQQHNVDGVVSMGLDPFNDPFSGVNSNNMHRSAGTRHQSVPTNMGSSSNHAHYFSHHGSAEAKGMHTPVGDGHSSSDGGMAMMPPPPAGGSGNNANNIMYHHPAIHHHNNTAGAPAAVATMPTHAPQQHHSSTTTAAVTQYSPPAIDFHAAAAPAPPQPLNMHHHNMLYSHPHNNHPHPPSSSSSNNNNGNNNGNTNNMMGFSGASSDHNHGGGGMGAGHNDIGGGGGVSTIGVDGGGEAYADVDASSDADDIPVLEIDLTN